MRFLLVLWAGIALATTSVAAQTGPTVENSNGLPAAEAATSPDEAANDDPIIVTGRTKPPTPSEVYEQARELSRVGRFQLYEEPLPRFQMPVCPGVFGLKADAAQTMVARIRANAERIGVKLAKRDCSPNFIVDFVDDGRKVMSDIAQAHRKAFCIVPTEEQVELLEDEAPVHVWLHTRTIDIRRTGGPTRIVRCHEDIPSISGGPGARMGVPMRKDIFLAVAVFDRQAALGRTLEQVSDYATMRGLSNTRPATGDEPLTTILGLFNEGGQRLEGLTNFDVGYLRSIYEAPGNDSAANRLLAVRQRTLQQQRNGEASHK